MGGSRTGDFSRFSFDPTRHDSAVWMQQGRVQLDSDWNTWVELIGHRLRGAALDLIGDHGAPADRAGFEIIPRAALAFAGQGQYAVVRGAGGAELVRHLAEGGAATFEIWLTSSRGGTVVGLWARTAAEGYRRLAVLAVGADGRPVLAFPGGEVVSSIPLQPGRPQHLAVVVSAAASEMFVGARPSGSGPGIRPPTADGAELSLLLGADLEANLPVRSFSGLAHEVRLWALPRRGDELRRAFQPEEAGLAGWWRFDRATGSTVADRSASGVPAVLGGGVPAHRPGWVLVDLQIGAGRYYVDGLLAQAEEPGLYTRQRDLPGAQLPAPLTSVEAARPDRPEAYLVYLDVWERGVTAAEDPDLAEPALNGLDTTARSRRVAQVRLLPVPAGDGLAGTETALAAWEAHRGAARRRGLLAAWREPAPTTVGNLLYRIEVHRGGSLYGAPPGEDEGIPIAAVNRRRLELERWPGGPEAFAAGDAVEVWSERTDLERRPGETARVVEADEAGAALSLDRDLSAMAADARLRVRRVATFKWARSNASVVLPVIRREAGSPVVQVRDLGRGEPPFPLGTPVELADDATTLSGSGSALAAVEAVDSAAFAVTLAAAPEGLVGTQPERRPVLRRWDHGATPGTRIGGALLAEAGKAFVLEDGIRVRFAGEGRYAAGDFWWIAARAAVDGILWPRDGSEPAKRPPDGVDRHAAPLALLVRDAEGIAATDLRAVFTPRVRGAVAKTGDVMTGPLTVRADLTATGAVRGRTLHGELGDDAVVHGRHLAPGAVGPAKVSPAVGLVPDGALILGTTTAAPAGYAATGSAMTLFHEAAAWEDRFALPGVAGGAFHAAEVDGLVVVVAESGDVWRIDLAAGSWERGADLPIPRRAFAVAATAGRIWVAGGLDAGGRPVAGLAEYDPLRNRWEERRAPAIARSHLALAAVDGRLHAVGGLVRGLAGRRPTAAHEIFDPAGDRWERRRPLPGARAGASAATVAGRLHVLGGERRWLFGRWGRVLTDRHDVYLPAGDRWLPPASPLPVPRRSAGLAVVFGRLYAAGGEAAFGPTAAVDEFDPATGVWLPKTPLHVPLAGPGVAASRGELVVAGAERGGPTPAVLVEVATVATRFHLHRRLPGAGDGFPGLEELR